MPHAAPSSTPNVPTATSASSRTPQNILKRDGRLVPFDAKKVIQAIAAAGTDTGEFKREEAARLAWRVTEELEAVYDGHTTPTVEQVQDMVEQVLMQSNWLTTAKSYILYREEHARLRRAAG